MSAPTVIGVDPGGATTGIVARRGSTLLAACSISFGDPDDLSGYLDEVLVAVLGYEDRHNADGIAVEDAIPPSPFVNGRPRISNPAGIIDAAKVLGAVVVMCPSAVILRPNGYGAPASSRAELLARYPAELVGAREKKGTGALRHVRSAWDIAGAADFEIRQRARTRSRARNRPLNP